MEVLRVGFWERLASEKEIREKPWREKINGERSEEIRIYFDLTLSL